MAASATTTGRKAGREAVMAANTVTVRIANFPIVNGYWGRIDGTVECEAKVLRTYNGKMVEVKLVNPPAPYKKGEVLALDILPDGSFGPAEVLGLLEVK